MYGRVQHGFDNFQLVFPSGVKEQIRATLLDFETGFAYRFFSLSESVNDPQQLHFALRIGAIYSHYLLEGAEGISRLPSTSTFGAAIGASVRQAVASDRIAVTARIDALPYQRMIRGREAFGETTFGYGTRGNVGFDIRLFGSAFANIGYGFSFTRHVLSGRRRAGGFSGHRCIRLFPERRSRSVVLVLESGA